MKKLRLHVGRIALFNLISMLKLKEKSSNPVELQNLNKIQIRLKELRNINFSKNVCWVDFIDCFQMYIIKQVFHSALVPFLT